MDDMQDLPFIEEGVEDEDRGFVCGPDCPGCIIRDICVFRELLVQAAL